MKKFWLIFFTVLMIFPRFCKAENNQGVSFSPPFTDIEIGSEKEKKIDLEISNQSESSLVFGLSVIDFGSLDESGGIAFLTTQPNSDERKYALASWISLEKSEVIVPPKSKEIIKVTILNKESLFPGGHYGAVLATIRNEEKALSDKVGINQSIASLLYVQKNGGETKNLILRNIYRKNPTLVFIKNIDLKFENNGNTHLVPRGKVEIKSITNKTVAKGIINEASNKILPETTRKITVNLDVFKKWIWPGKYFIEINYRFDGKEEFINYKNSFLYIGIEGIIIFVSGILLFFYFLLKKKNLL